jgi:formylglycine-generating enzyme required for sulfatase activity
MSSRTWLRLVAFLGLLIVAAFVVPAWTQDEKGKKADNKPAKKEIINSIGMKLVLIPKGKFTMGSPPGETGRRDDEKQHEVEITRDFYLGVYEVTQKQYRTVMGHNPSYFSRDGTASKEGEYKNGKPAGGKDKVKDFKDEELDEFPVENVSWEDAQTFLKKLNALAAEKEKGRRYRLPTEAEWEYACRGGAASSKAFHTGDALSSEQANFSDTKLGRTEKVGSYKANAFGLYDMHGNVWEWCADWYGSDYYGKSPRRDPKGRDEGSDRVCRGGCWYLSAWDCRSAFRIRFVPGRRVNDLGFRVALDPMPFR